MVHVVIARIVGGEMLKWVEGKSVAAVVVNSFHRGAGEEAHSLAGV